MSQEPLEFPSYGSGTSGRGGQDAGERDLGVCRLSQFRFLQQAVPSVLGARVGGGGGESHDWLVESEWVSHPH